MASTWLYRIFYLLDITSRRGIFLFLELGTKIDESGYWTSICIGLFLFFSLFTAAGQNGQNDVGWPKGNRLAVRIISFSILLWQAGGRTAVTLVNGLLYSEYIRI